MANKYIIIPDYKPLYAMRYCFGPTHGPLEKPCPTPIDIIGKLLLQSGNDKLNIYEVKVDPKTHMTIGEPIKLTLSNYKQPYDKLANINTDGKIGEKITKENKNDPVVITPTKKRDTEDSAIVTPKKEESLVETKNTEPSINDKLSSIPEEEPDEIDEVMIQNIDTEDTTLVNLEDIEKPGVFYSSNDITNAPIPGEPVETVYDPDKGKVVLKENPTTIVVTTATSTDGESVTTNTVYETPTEDVNTVFVTGMTTENDDTNAPETVTTTTSDTYMVPVTTSEGTKYLNTGMTEAEYKSLSKSERRRLRKNLAEEDNFVDPEEIEKLTPM